MVGDKLGMWHELVSKVLNIVLSNANDSFKWTLTKNSEFNVKSMYKNLMQTGSLPITNIAWKLKVPLKIKIFFAPSHPRPPVVTDPFGRTLPRLFSRPPVVDAMLLPIWASFPAACCGRPSARRLCPPLFAPPVCWCCTSAMRSPLFYTRTGGFSALLVFCRTEEGGVLCPDLLLQGYFCLVLSVIEAGCPSHSFLLLVFCISAAPEVLCGWSVVQHIFILCFEYKY